MTLKFPSSSHPSNYGKMCLLLDGAPPPGDATGCEPRIDPKTSEMSWDNFRMQLKNQEVNSITLQWTEKKAKGENFPLKFSNLLRRQTISCVKDYFDKCKILRHLRTFLLMILSDRDY